MKKFLDKFPYKEIAMAVIEQVGDEEALKNEFDNYSRACDGAFGFTTYTETMHFFKEYKPIIVEFLHRLSEDWQQTPMDILCDAEGLRTLDPSHWTTFKHIAETLYGENTDVMIANAIAWFCYDYVSNEYQIFNKLNK